MKARQIIERLATQVVMRGFRLRDYNAVFGVKHAAPLAALLELDDAAQLYRDVYGLHNLRWMLFDPSQKSGVVSIDPTQRQALVLSLIYDGNFDDVMGGLIQRAGPRLREILAHCFGFEATTDVVGFIQRHAAPSDYLFRDLGPLLLTPEPAPAPAPPAAAASQSGFVAEALDLLNAFRTAVARELSDDAPPPDADPTRTEIEDAYALQRRFERFYTAQSEVAPGELRAAFQREFSDAAFPFPLTRFERQAEAEEVWTRRMTEVSRRLQERTARTSHDGLMRRGAHAKAHGLLVADFEVLTSGLPGLFGEKKTYRAVLRPSNGDSRVRPDKKRDARGLALGVMIPADEPIGGSLPRFLLPLERQSQGRQDFVLMNQPVFVAPDVTRFAWWFKTAQSDRRGDQLLALLALLGLPGGPRQFGILARTSASRLSNPLDADYHSTTPYLFGAGHLAKYSLALSPADRRRLRGCDSPFDPDALGSALKASLRDRPLVMKFLVHRLSVDAPPSALSSLTDAVEDATLDWRKLGAEELHVANVVIGAQDPTTLERLNQAELERFNPWHALVEHRPLGSLNRARLAAYRASQGARSAESVAVGPRVLALAAE